MLETLIPTCSPDPEVSPYHHPKGGKMGKKKGKKKKERKKGRGGKKGKRDGKTAIQIAALIVRPPHHFEKGEQVGKEEKKEKKIGERTLTMGRVYLIYYPSWEKDRGGLGKKGGKRKRKEGKDKKPARRLLPSPAPRLSAKKEKTLGEKQGGKKAKGRDGPPPLCIHHFRSGRRERKRGEGGKKGKKKEGE